MTQPDHTAADAAWNGAGGARPDPDADLDVSELTDEQAREMLGDRISFHGDWKPWKPAIRGAIRDAIIYRTHFSHHEDNADCVSLWHQCAADLDIDLSDTEAEAGATR